MSIDNKSLETTVNKVVLYRDQAQISRTTTVQLTPGEHILNFSEKWSRVNRETLQVSVASAAIEEEGSSSNHHVVLNGVQFTTLYLDIRQEKSKELAELKHKRSQLRQTRKELQNEVESRQHGISLYEQLQKKMTAAEQSTGAGKDTKGQPKELVYQPEKQFELVELVSTAIENHYEEIFKEQTKLKKLSDQLETLEREIAKLTPCQYSRTETTKEVAEVNLTVLCSKEKDIPVNITLSYLVPDASWLPLYDLRVDTVTKTLQVSYHALVKQATGEEWSEIQMELSTARPQVSAKVPLLEPWKIKEDKPVILRKSAMKGRSRAMKCKQEERVMAPPPQMFMANMMPAEAEEMDLLEELDYMIEGAQGGIAAAPRVMEASVQSGSGAASASFKIALPVSLKGNNQQTKVSIAVCELPIELRYSAVPRLDPHVYLKVKAVNTSAFHFLAGNASVFAGGQLLTTTTLDNVAVGEEFWTFLGTDAEVQCIRRTVQSQRAAVSNWLSHNTTRHERGYTFVCSNNKASDVELVVWDQLPVADHKKILIHLQTPTETATTVPGNDFEEIQSEEDQNFTRDPKKEKATAMSIPVKTNEEKLVEWMVKINPQHEVRFDFSYSVTHPAGRVVGGL